jgi:hypothetical protein
MPFDAPFKLGPFAVDSGGRLTPAEPGRPPVFLCRWHGRVVRSRLARTGTAPEKLVLLIEAALGRVPSTAGGGGEKARPRSFALLRWLTRVVPDDWRLRLAPDHRIWLEAETRIGLPITAPGLLTEVTRFLLELSPYLDLLDESWPVPS